MSTGENDGSPTQGDERSKAGGDASGNQPASDSAVAPETGTTGDGNASEGSAEAGSGGAATAGSDEQHSGDGVQDAAGSSDAAGVAGSGDTSGAGDQAEAKEGEETPPEVNDDIVDAELPAEEIQQLSGRQKSFAAADPLEAMETRPIDPPITYVTWLEGLVAHYRDHTAELRGICNRVGVATPQLPHYPDYVPGE